MKDYNRQQAINDLIDELDKGRKSGDKKGWTLHEDMRVYQLLVQMPNKIST